MHTIAKYLSYTKLSKNHRAFLSKISQLFVPRNIQEALSDLNWKLAVMEEMNELEEVVHRKLSICQETKKWWTANRSLP